jgi:hypothetical protein
MSVKKNEKTEPILTDERKKALFCEDGTPKYLRYYTQIPFALKTLKEKKLHLGDTIFFKDPIDREWTRASLGEGKKLYALCLTYETELIHHWHDYADGQFGCCIVFDGRLLIEAAKKKKLSCNLVDYNKNISRHPKEDNHDTAPFCKAWPYRCEHEYRIISKTAQELQIEFDWIQQITITSLLDNKSFNFFKAEINSIDKEITVKHSRLEKEID